MSNTNKLSYYVEGHGWLQSLPKNLFQVPIGTIAYHFSDAGTVQVYEWAKSIAAPSGDWARVGRAPIMLPQGAHHVASTDAVTKAMVSAIEVGMAEMRSMLTDKLDNATLTRSVDDDVESSTSVLVSSDGSEDSTFVPLSEMNRQQLIRIIEQMKGQLEWIDINCYQTAKVAKAIREWEEAGYEI